MNRTRTLVLAAALALAVVATMGTTGCRRVRLAPEQGTGGLSETTKTVALGAATTLGTTVRFGVGTLKLGAVEGSAGPAMEGTFTYPAETWKPEVDYSVETSRGTLSIVQPDIKRMPVLGPDENSWDVRLARGVPTDLVLDLGVGESAVDLSGVDVTMLRASSGVGHVALDLTGERSHDVTGTVSSGVGEVDIAVPSDVAVKLVGGTSGIGALEAPGFTESDGGLVNAAWGKPGPRIVLTLSRGVGAIVVETR